MDDRELCLAGAFRQADLVRSGAVSARELIEATLRRIDEHNPRLNAYRVVLADEALDEATKLDSHRADRRHRPLHGVPVAIKDDTDVAGHVTAWGTSAHGPAATTDAEVVERLRKAGGIIIGKTHVPELSLWPWTTSTTFGSTTNPWNHERTAGGSSGGSAAAAAAGLCGAALGSDGGGSVRYPAALTGLFGLKPQRDRIPLGDAHQDAWNGLLAYGPLCRTPRDAAAFLDATADDGPVGGYAAVLDAAPSSLNIAMSFDPPTASFARLDDEHRRAVERTAEMLRSFGHTVIEAEVDYGSAMTNATLRYLAGVHDDAASMAHPQRLARTTRGAALLGGLVPSAALRRARRAEDAIATHINRSFLDHNVDVVLTPMAAAPPLIADVVERGLVRSLFRSNVAAWAVPWNVIGQPAASVFAGFDAAGLPMSAQLCGRPGDETTILRLAQQLASVCNWT